MKYNLVREYHRIYKESIIVATEIGKVHNKVLELIVDMTELEAKIKELEYDRKTPESRD